MHISSKSTNLKLILVVLFFLTSFSNYAQISSTPTSAQIEQFKNLPKSQQIALAKQLGLDLNSIQGASNNNIQKDTVRPEQVYLEEQTENESKQPSVINTRKKLKPFGYDMFARLQDAFLPNGNIPIPGDYMVGPGDTLKVSFFGKESSEYSVTINNDGKITLPGLEPLIVSGLSYSELKLFMSNVVKTKMIGIKSTVTLANLRGIQIYVVGDVKNPGAYYLSSLSTLTNALFISGGPSEVGSLRNIQLRRAGKVISILDLYKLFTHGDVSQDVRLQQGDVIFVAPIAKQVAISGEVRRPAIYEVIEDDTVADLVKMAGGLNVNAYPKHTILTRLDENYQRDVRRINLDNKEVTKQKLKNGDVLTVLPVSGRLDQVVNVAGAVSRPTTYAWSDGMTISDLIVSRDDLLDSTDLNYGLILSKKVTGNYVITQFKPEEALNGNSEVLHPGDLVVFFNRYGNNTFLKNEESFNFKDKDKDKDKNKDKEFIASLLLEQKTSNSVFKNFSNEVTINYDKKLNYLYALKNGSLFDKQEALLATKFMSREELITPIIKLLSNSTEAGRLIPIVYLTGQVRFPGSYPIANNSKLADVILAGGGLKESANLIKGEISRVIEDENEFVKIEHINFDLIGALSGVETHNLAVEPRDVINVFQQANWNDNIKVKISGEVKYPGEYTINEGETLSEVIKRAGGITELAATKSAFFTRQSLRDLEQKQARDMARSLSKELALKSISSSMSSINVSEVQGLVSQLTTIEGVGRLIIDLPQLIVDSNYDVVLENGDELTIPSFRNEVNVVGEVQVATSHIHNETWNLYDYIRSSGGLRQQSDEDRIYIVRSNGLVDAPVTGWFSSKKELVINPGDTIVVPLDADYTDKLTLWEKATSIFYNSVIALAALNSL